MNSTYKIELKNCAFFGYHGVLDDEKLNGQKFYVDTALTIAQPPEFGNDLLDGTVNYALVFELIELITTKERFDLIETLAHTISQRICAEFPKVQSALVTVKKPSAPINGSFDYVSVSVEAQNRD